MKKIKILILGITGTLGHKIAQELIKDKRNVIFGTYNDKNKFFRLNSYLSFVSFHQTLDISAIFNLIRTENFDYVINCSGIIKQKIINQDIYFKINTILPKKISKIASIGKFYFIHFSTDCVFNGKIGNYTELDIPDANDLYGKTKILGEPDLKLRNCLTFRTSFIGHEINHNFSLLNWFVFNKRKKIYGFQKCFFSGVTNLEISKIIRKLIKNNKFIEGIFNLSGISINKFQLLNLINRKYQLKKIIIRKNYPIINRTLSNKKFQKFFKYKEKKWPKLLNELFIDYKKNIRLYKN
jgi:dTDP-4-dehydrorhamnose reductase